MHIIYGRKRTTIYHTALPFYESADQIEDNVKILMFMNDNNLFGNTAKYLINADKKCSLSNEDMKYIFYLNVH